METFEALFTRRSIRKYTDKAVEDEKIQEILKAAMYAPSARNTQPWQFLVISEKGMLNKIKQVHPYASMLAEAPLAVLVCGDKTYEPDENYLNTNCSAATQNLLLAAHALGLGGVWLGVFPRKERMDALTNLFGLPENITPISLVAIGYPDEKKSVPGRFLPERIHYNKW
jgi:nitroreductase